LFIYNSSNINILRINCILLNGTFNNIIMVIMTYIFLFDRKYVAQ
jgi:hypothetical protein